MGESEVAFGCFFVFAGVICFGSLSIGKEMIDPEKTIRNILQFFVWALLGFGMMSVGIANILGRGDEDSLMLGFMIGFVGLGLLIAYVVSIIKTKDYYAIASVALVVIGFVLGANSNGIFILGVLTMLCLLAALVLFVVSLLKGMISD